jgi:lysine-N-methylase
MQANLADMPLRCANANEVRDQSAKCGGIACAVFASRSNASERDADARRCVVKSAARCAASAALIRGLFMQELTSVPRYLNSFSCLGSTCPDTCCGGWKIEVDKATHQSWQTIRLHKDAPPLAASTQPARADPQHAEGARVVLEQTPTGHCVLLTQDKLCPVHMQLGEAALPLVCHTYPRGLVQMGEQTSMVLTLSCPQAARLALADAEAMDRVPPRQQPSGRLPALRSSHRDAATTTRQFAASPLDGVTAAAPMLADAAHRLIRAPELTVWQAWALYWQHAVGVLTALESNADKRAAAEQLAALQQLSRQSEGLLPAAQLAEENFVARALPMPARLDNALRFAHDWARGVQEKYGDTGRHNRTPALSLPHAMAPFGLGDEPTSDALAIAGDLHERGRRDWFEPFDHAHPHLLKNYLQNRLALRNFPRGETRQFGEELVYEMMDLDALRVFLVGQALTKRSEFGIDDYVVLVQAYTRYVVNPMDRTPAAALNEETPCTT